MTENRTLKDDDFETRLANAVRIVTAADPAYYLVPGLDRTVGHRGELRLAPPPSSPASAGSGSGHPARPADEALTASSP